MYPGEGTLKPVIVSEGLRVKTGKSHNKFRVYSLKGSTFHKITTGGGNRSLYRQFMRNCFLFYIRGGKEEGGGSSSCNESMTSTDS